MQKVIPIKENNSKNLGSLNKNDNNEFLLNELNT
jgi:hypothetical protein